MNPFRDHERFKNLCAGFQSLVVGLAVVVGGIWAAYLFKTEQRVEHARLTAAKIELENQWAIRKAREKRIETELQLEQFAAKEGPWRYISVVLTVTNPGVTPIHLDLDEGPVTATRVLIGKGAEVKFGPTFAAAAERIAPDGRRIKLSTLIVESHSKESLPFLIAVDQPGLYLIGYNSHTKRARVSELIGGNVKTWGAAK